MRLLFKISITELYLRILCKQSTGNTPNTNEHGYVRILVKLQRNKNKFSLQGTIEVSWTSLPVNCNLLFYNSKHLFGY